MIGSRQGSGSRAGEAACGHRDAPRRLVAGVGCRRGAPAETVVAALRLALQECGRALEEVASLATVERKREETGIAAAAGTLDLPLAIVADVDAAARRTLTISTASHAATGIGCVAEAAALAAAGPGARLLAPRCAARRMATCALAEPPWP